MLKNNFGSNEKKKIIKVLIIRSDMQNSFGAYIYKDISDNPLPGGFSYDIWLKVKNILSSKYEFKEIFTDPKKNNYDQIAKDTAAGKYDIVIGLFIPSIERNKLVYITTPILLAYNVILQKKFNNIVNRFIYVIKKSVWYILFLFILGIISGLVFFGIEMGSLKNLKNISHFKHFKRLTLSAFISFFGQKGLLLEHTNLTPISIITVLIMMILSFIIIFYIQGIMTNININHRKIGEMKKSNLKTIKVLGLAGYASCAKLERFGIKYIPVKNKSLPEIVTYYLNNSNKYDGVCMMSPGANSLQQQFPNMQVSASEFGGEYMGWIVNKNKTALLKDVNKILINLKDNHFINRICNSWFDDKNICTG